MRCCRRETNDRNGVFLEKDDTNRWHYWWVNFDLIHEHFNILQDYQKQYDAWVTNIEPQVKRWLEDGYKGITECFDYNKMNDAENWLYPNMSVKQAHEYLKKFNEIIPKMQETRDKLEYNLYRQKCHYLEENPLSYEEYFSEEENEI